MVFTRFPEHRTFADVLEHLRSFHSKKEGTDMKTIIAEHHIKTGPTSGAWYAVIEQSESGHTWRWIAIVPIDLLSLHIMREHYFPYHWDCPLNYLELVPEGTRDNTGSLVTNSSWRKQLLALRKCDQKTMV